MKYINNKILFSFFALFMVNLNYAEDLVLEDYFPLQCGNQWEFQTIPVDTNLSLTWSITDTVNINDMKYFIFNERPIRKDSAGSIWEYRNGKDILWFDFSQNGDSIYTYEAYNDGEYLVNITKNLTVSCPLGEFNNSIYFDFYIPNAVDANYNYYFAPDMGPVFYWTALNFYELCRATINGRNFTHVRYQNEIPSTIQLEQNFPNPFNHSTRIDFSANKNTNIKIDIYDINGKEIETLLNRFVEAKKHTITWDASKLPSGQYFILLTANGHTKIIKSIYIK